MLIKRHGADAEFVAAARVPRGWHKGKAGALGLGERHRCEVDGDPITAEGSGTGPKHDEVVFLSLGCSGCHMPFASHVRLSTEDAHKIAPVENC